MQVPNIRGRRENLYHKLLVVSSWEAQSLASTSTWDLGVLQGSYHRILPGDTVSEFILRLVSICSVWNSHFWLLNHSRSVFSCQLPDSHGEKRRVFSFQHPSPSSLLLWKRKQASYFCYSSFPSASVLQDLYLMWITPVPIPTHNSSFCKLQHGIRGLLGFPAQHGAPLENTLRSW